MGITLALARYPHLRALVGAPVTVRDLPEVVDGVVARLAGRPAPPAPSALPGDGSPRPTTPLARTGERPWWVNLGLEAPP